METDFRMYKETKADAKKFLDTHISDRFKNRPSLENARISWTRTIMGGTGGIAAIIGLFLEAPTPAKFGLIAIITACGYALMEAKNASIMRERILYDEITKRS